MQYDATEAEKELQATEKMQAVILIDITDLGIVTGMAHTCATPHAVHFGTCYSQKS